MISAMAVSKIRQKIGLAISGDNLFAPKPKEKNQRKLAVIAPEANSGVCVPNWLAKPPMKITVSAALALIE